MPARLVLALLLASAATAAAEEPPALCDKGAEGCELAKPWRDWIAASPSRPALFAYAVKCAMPGEVSVTVPGGEPLQGGWGLRRDWQRGPLDDDGQELISSCILAHINARGEHVKIAITGPDMTFTPPPAFRNLEGVFFGNLFAGTKKSVCKGFGDGFGSAAVDEGKRICATDSAACGLESTGACWGNPDVGCTRWAGLAPHVYCTEARDTTGRRFRHPVTVYLRTSK